ncbi:hypothetical protein [Mycoplasmoides fastidiosum]|nr:hypothetical protein [Mycoplasmoides fastidiosum]UUD37898.1 hypothetical protein NPA10_00675 [Mycoplasmoides fastidiosum]
MKKFNFFKSSQLWLTSFIFSFITSFVLSACAEQIQNQKSNNQTESPQFNSKSDSNNNSQTNNSNQANNSQTNSRPEANSNSGNDAETNNNTQADQPNIPKKNEKSDNTKPQTPRASAEQIATTKLLVNSKEFQHLLEYENRENKNLIYTYYFNFLNLVEVFNNDRIIEKILPYLNIQKPELNWGSFVRKQANKIITTTTPISSLITQLKSKIDNVFSKQENENQRTGFQSLFQKLITNIENLTQNINDFISDNSDSVFEKTKNDFIMSVHKYLNTESQNLQEVLGQILQEEQNYFNQIKLLADKLSAIEKNIMNLKSLLKEINAFKSANNNLFVNNETDKDFTNDLQSLLNTLEQQVLLSSNNSAPNTNTSDNSLLDRVQMILSDYKKFKSELHKILQVIVFNKNLLTNNSEAINLLALNINTTFNNDVNNLKEVDKEKNLYNTLTIKNESEPSFQTIFEEIKKISDADNQHQLDTKLDEFKSRWESFKKLIWENNHQTKTIYPFINLAKKLSDEINKASTYQNVLTISAIINEIRNFYSKITHFVSTKENVFAEREDTDFFNELFQRETPLVNEEAMSELKTFMQKLDELIKKEKTETPTNANFSFTKLKNELEKLQDDDWEFRDNSLNPSSKISTFILKLTNLNLFTQKNKLHSELAEKFHFGRK